MNIIHISDTHLGYSAYHKMNNDGINQREIDNYNSFKQFVDYIVNEKPDLILHAGDLFDSVRPNNRAITFALKQILRISKEGIPFVIIAGNHEHPKLKETGHIFSIFEHIDNIFPIYNSKYEKLSFVLNEEKISIHCLPQTYSKEDFNKNLEKIKIDISSKYNVLITHGGLRGIKEFSMNEFNEQIIPEKYLRMNFDYIALGHYHKYTKISSNCYYSGSTESFTFSDANDKKGFIEINLNAKNISQKFINLKTRSMLDYKPINCLNLTVDEVNNNIKEKIKEIKPNDKIIRIKLKNISPHDYRGLDFDVIKELTSKALHFEIKADTIKNNSAIINENSYIDSLAQEFELFLNNQNIENKELFLKLGINYIKKIEAKNEEK